MRPISASSRGVGLRQEHLAQLCAVPARPGIDFLELAPENWMAIGGARREQLQQIAARYPLVAHGLSLSLGDCQPLNMTLLGQIRAFLDEFGIEIYSEHLSFSRDARGYLYELLPVPRQWENLPYLAERIRQVQDALARPLVLENISYYHGYEHEMAEEAFLTELVARSGCELLLDINNVFVNSRNHGYCPERMIAGLPGQAIRYFHIAGHLEEADGTLLDTHGRPVCEEVVALARYTVQTHGLRPLLLERDHHLPPLPVLEAELARVHQACCEVMAHPAGREVCHD
ncbi:DUF692 domain-containing protein [Aeromonas dhakensis]|uniref:DUF692 domain-containing protein n=1 Tax=Aeromonas TaxID=642 RepID=UPI00191D151D|nr:MULTISPECIES: DUF692 domain-containing protein [Aeromonas]MDD9307104.1 DUF692 domain-containing protein [Aeromonas hydrophila]ELM3750127.1 DUF692 domain-containing protein [Aeromonas dhakensis]MBL0604324.1 DUF692 domain-containing protein [Aeromonas dhakensis]MBL0617564.1 DUF692 domain-containing protein [Aeromonas dhakensis]UCM46763.1 DUF692 domain-containing protein [Aeromonas dhakensis]